MAARRGPSESRTATFSPPERQHQRALDRHGGLGIAEIVAKPRQQHLPARFDAHQINTKGLRARRSDADR
jgi:hypothetical protein